MKNDKRYSVGCDIGGSHISCGLIELTSGKMEPNSLVSVPVDNNDEKDIILSAWAKAIGACMKNLPSGAEMAGVGLAIPGPFDYEKGIGLYENLNKKFVNMYHVNVRTELSRRLNISPDKFKFVNDATAFSLGAFWYGSGKGSKQMVGITLGTGFGSSFVSNGTAIEDGPTVPDEGCLWHIPYKEGIADDYFSTRWFVANFNERSTEQVTGVKRIAELAYSKNNLALEIFSEFGTNLADCLADPLRNFNTDVVVMGGNIAEAFDLFRPSLTKALGDKKLDIQFKVSELKETAAMLGAATMFK